MITTESPTKHGRWAGKPLNKERGLTLVELMVAITVGLFLVGGVLTIVQSTRNTFATQNTLAQFQDNERLALSFMSEVIESAGYFPNPKLYTAGQVLPAAGVFAVAQSVYGTHNAAAPGDTVTVRFGAALNDDVFNCSGAINTGVAPYDTFVNQFYVNAATNQLMCTATTSAGNVTVPLVNNVTNLQTVYGIKRNPADTGSCTDTYLTANQMLVADWPNVCSITVTVTFINPLTPAAAPVSISRVIAVMNAAGVNS